MLHVLWPVNLALFKPSPHVLEPTWVGQSSERRCGQMCGPCGLDRGPLILRDAAGSPRDLSPPSPNVRRSTERTRGETPRAEARSVYVREPRPKDVPSRDSRAVLYDRYRGYVAHNLMEGVVLPDVKRVQRFFLSQREIQLILAKAQEPHRTWYGLAAETGLRAGELCGLTVEDIDLERGMLQVRQSAWRGKLGDPKTDESIRVVELSPQACKAPEDVLGVLASESTSVALRHSQRNAVGSELVTQTKVQTFASGARYPGATRQWLLRVPSCERALMSSFGASQKLLQQRLGHADGSPVTETIYTHVISEDGKRIAAQLGNAVWRILDASWTEKHT